MAKLNEAECGHGVEVMTGIEHFVGEDKANWFHGKPWSQLRNESVLCPAEECYAPLAAYIINACKKMNCNSQVTEFKIKLDSLNGVAGAINGAPSK